MTGNMKLWLKNLYLEAAEQHRGAAQNENLWALGADDEEATIMHFNNAVEHLRFVEILTSMANDLGEG